MCTVSAFIRSKKPKLIKFIKIYVVVIMLREKNVKCLNLHSAQ